MEYSWQGPDWPEFRFEATQLEEGLLRFAQYSGRVGGLLEGLPEGLEAKAILDLMIAEAMSTSSIEGEILQAEEVNSSIRNHLGLNVPDATVKDLRAVGVGELMVAVRRDFANPLSEEMLLGWHRMVMKGEKRLQVGAWREGKDPMQVVSGRMDRPTVHFEAPPSDRVPEEMEAYIEWFNRTRPGGAAPIVNTPVRAGLAHLYFETIHPFDDGNGRIGRAIAEKVLSQGLGFPVVMSLSQTIEANRSAYYDALKQSQRSMEVTDWLKWFVETVVQAQLDAEARISFSLNTTKYLGLFREQLSERELKVVERMLEAGPEGFEGGMNARKYVALTKASKATATRDLQHLAQIGAMRSVGGGRSTRYELSL